MLEKKELNEIKKRDFLKYKNFYNIHQNVKSVKCIGSNNKTPFVTIVMPIYKHPVELLKRAVKSAIQQYNFDDYKILIVDNNTSSESKNEEIIRTFDTDRIIYYKNEKNIGLFGNWNRCIELAQSEWITFLHSDDMLYKNFLITMVSIIKAHPEIDQLACNYKRIDLDKIKRYDLDKESDCVYGKKLIREINVREYYERMVTSVKGAFLKREHMLKLGGFRDIGDGIGLGDYIAMLQYAYYYKTFLLEENLYINFFGMNDSLNTSLWYSELVANYYMRNYFSKKNNFIIRKIKNYRYMDKLVSEVKMHNSEDNWLGIIIPMDLNSILSDCDIDKLPNKFLMKLISKIYYKVSCIYLSKIENKFTFLIKK